MHIKAQDKCEVYTIDEDKTIHKIITTTLNKYKVRINNDILIHSYSMPRNLLFQMQ